MSLTTQTLAWPEANLSRFPDVTYAPSGACLMKISTPERLPSLQHRSGRVEAVFGVNPAAEVQAGRRLIAIGNSMQEDWLASSGLPLRTMFRQVA